ncbi:conjugative transposon protein TraM [uncultured Aquimarina sp.]|uniref:conjugative transposon protein TraM n=1 Tax=uncultured Aquimarina sp. TaxID=575652 RepID=UPI00262D5A5A|nr:conjugative transposon protein TraM [uncultured Aquimarina sp.]
MDKKKKTIVAIVGVGCIVLLTVLLKIIIFPSSQAQKRKNQLSISTPKVDEQKIKPKSKIEEYERESFDNIERSDVVKGLGNVEKEQEENVMDESLIIGDETETRDKLPEILKNTRRKQPNYGNQSTPSFRPEPVNDEIQQLMELQEQLMAQSMEQVSPNGNYTDIEDIQKLMETYSEITQASQQNQTGIGGLAVNQLTPEKITEISTNVSEKIAGQIQSKFKQQNYFHGAGSGYNKDEVLGLIPAETVDQGILVQGSTIAIRTKKEVRLTNPAVLIPKGAIVYGRISFGTNRLLIDINSYKDRDQLYILDFSLFDFDGIEGIHLGNRTWPKMPGQVAKDVYNYAYQKGTQAATFGNNDSGVNLDEAKDIAILSATKEAGKEAFDKRRVFMPKKYHLWFNINTK